MVLVSQLSVEDCLDKVGYRLLLESGSIKSKMNGTKLKACKRISYQNSFQRVLSARFSEDEIGTFITCDFSVTPFVAAFLVIWFGFVMIFSFIGVGSLAAAGYLGHKVFFGELFFPIDSVFLIGFGWLLLKFGIALSVSGEDFLIAMLRYETKADIFSAHGICNELRCS